MTSPEPPLSTFGDPQFIRGIRLGIRRFFGRLVRPLVLGLQQLRASMLTPRAIIRRSLPGGAPDAGRRLCIFSHHDRFGRIDDYVLHYLRALNEVGCSIVFVTTCRRIPAHDFEALRPLVSRIVFRRNVGRDFGSWKAGLVAGPDPARYEQLVFANDSVYGPFYPLADVFDKMSQRPYDLWGATDSREHAYHLQSYLLVLQRRAVQSPFFKFFWDRYRFVTEKDYIIKHYELGFTQWALRWGLRVGALCEYDLVRQDVLSQARARKELDSFMHAAFRAPVNPTHFFWRALIERHGCPFLKIELVRANPSRISDLWSWPDVVAATGYPRELIAHHLKRVGGKFRFGRRGRGLVPPDPGAASPPPGAG